VNQPDDGNCSICQISNEMALTAPTRLVTVLAVSDRATRLAFRGVGNPSARGRKTLKQTGESHYEDQVDWRENVNDNSIEQGSIACK
jgi:hypothetical protein